MSNVLFDALFANHIGSEAPFLILPDGDVWSYQRFLETAAQYAHELEALGVGVGDRLAVQVQKSPEALATYAACLQAGVIFLPLNTAYTAHEMAYFIENSAAKLVLCDAKAETALRPVAQAAQAQLQVLNGDGSGFTSLAMQHPKSFQPRARSGDDLAAFLYTSGTTGRSKGAMLSHDNLLSNAKTLCDALRFTAQDVLLHALPIFHTHGLFVATNICLLAGCSMRFYPAFDAKKLIQDMPMATTFMGVPTFYSRLLNEPNFTKSVTENMRLFVSGSAPLPTETHEAFESRTGHRILERYGMTETNMNTSNPYNAERRAGTVGFPLPGIELRIIDEITEELLFQGEIGMIEIRGPNVFQGYWNMPEKTAADLRENEFFITGDLGKIDARGYVHIVGRSKDLIISGGYNIYPKEIEQILDDVPGVLESAVIGVPHADFGETVLAVVVLRSGVTLRESDLAAEVAQKLARFKNPKFYQIIAELPRNTMGKVQKNLLRDMYKGFFAAQ
jgi:malonyl-CoA/methylmalonyl-CoA synthetase